MARSHVKRRVDGTLKPSNSFSVVQVCRCDRLPLITWKGYVQSLSTCHLPSLATIRPFLKQQLLKKKGIIHITLHTVLHCCTAHTFPIPSTNKLASSKQEPSRTWSKSVSHSSYLPLASWCALNVSASFSRSLCGMQCNTQKFACAKKGQQQHTKIMQ